MKKIISILLALVLCFSSICAFAAPDIDKVFNAQYTDFEATTEISLTIDKPFEVFDAVADAIDEFYEDDSIKFSDIIDLRGLIETLFDSTQKMNLKCDLSKDFKKFNIYLSGSSNTPIKLNKSFTITTDAKNEIWLKFDFSDISNPIYKIIISSPASEKYMVMDYAKLYDKIGSDESIASLSSVFNEDYVKSLSKISIDTLKNNADISYKGGYFVIKMNDTQAKSWIVDVIYEAINLVSIPDVSFTTEQANQIKLLLKGVNIFGKNGIEMKYKANSKGIISAEETKMSFDFNLYDILTIASADFIEGITKENSNIAFSINSKSKYNKVNKGEKVKFPTLTEENTIDLVDFFIPETIYDDEYIPRYEYFYIQTNEPIIENGIAYVPLKEFMSTITNDDAYISQDNGNIKITSVTKFFNEINIKEGENIVVKDGNEITLDEPVKKIDGKIALSYEFIEKVFGCVYYHVYYSHGSDIPWRYNVDIYNPDYKEYQLQKRDAQGRVLLGINWF